MPKFTIQDGHALFTKGRPHNAGESIELEAADAEGLLASGAIAPAEEAPKAKGKGKAAKADAEPAAEADTAAEPAAE